MSNLPNQNKLLCNFLRCKNWEERYLYLIELGEKLLPLSNEQKQSKNKITGCQSQVWIVMNVDIFGKIHFLGDSDAAIVKGLVALIIIIFQNKTGKEILNINTKFFFKKLSLERHLTPSRSQGLHTIVQTILQRTHEIIQSKP
ncbi:MAG: cysteine desulfuration protein SufE [Arsenophonus sp.]|nr:MAG: cysteine desulfuration protein SufE [Arsenophonus sp.]